MVTMLLILVLLRKPSLDTEGIWDGMGTFSVSQQGALNSNKTYFSVVPQRGITYSVLMH